MAYHVSSVQAGFQQHSRTMHAMRAPARRIQPPRRPAAATPAVHIANAIQTPSTPRLEDCAVSAHGAVTPMVSSPRAPTPGRGCGSSSSCTIPSVWAASFELSSEDPVLGGGAFAQIFRVRDRSTGQQFAMKVMSRPNYVMRGIGHQVEAEVIAMKRATENRAACHHVVHFADMTEEGEHVYIRMEMCTCDLLQYTINQSERRLGEGDAMVCTLQLMSGLRDLHQIGILHRDIKPENLLLTSSGVLKIADFGWCADLRDAPCALAGTFQFMAPEILAEHGVQTEAVDVWSAAVTMITLITGCQVLATYLGPGATGYSQEDPHQAIKVKRERLLAEIHECMPPAEAGRPAFISWPCWDLLRRTLVPQVLGRISAAEALCHPWLQQGIGRELRINAMRSSEALVCQNIKLSPPAVAEVEVVPQYNADSNNAETESPPILCRTQQQRVVAPFDAHPRFPVADPVGRHCLRRTRRLTMPYVPTDFGKRATEPTPAAARSVSEETTRARQCRRCDTAPTLLPGLPTASSKGSGSDSPDPQSTNGVARWKTAETMSTIQPEPERCTLETMDGTTLRSPVMTVDLRRQVRAISPQRRPISPAWTVGRARRASLPAGKVLVLAAPQPGIRSPPPAMRATLAGGVVSPPVPSAHRLRGAQSPMAPRCLRSPGVPYPLRPLPAQAKIAPEAQSFPSQQAATMHLAVRASQAVRKVGVASGVAGTTTPVAVSSVTAGWQGPLWKSLPMGHRDVVAGEVNQVVGAPSRDEGLAHSARLSRVSNCLRPNRPNWRTGHASAAAPPPTWAAPGGRTTSCWVPAAAGICSLSQEFQGIQSPRQVPPGTEIIRRLHVSPPRAATVAARTR